MIISYLGLGSNLGDGRANLDRSLRLIARHVGEIVAVSGYIESEPWGFESMHRFTNAVCAVRTELSPLQLLDVTQDIERQMGRTHKHSKGESYTDRIIDIDILLYGEEHIDLPRLTVPHPLIAERDFVSRPLAECQAKVGN